MSAFSQYSCSSNASDMAKARVFTFKTRKPTGKWRSFFETHHDVKLDGKDVGSIDDKQPHTIRLMVHKADISCEGSGWAVLHYCKQTGRPIIAQVEKHNVNIIPGFAILLVLDVWEHAYYLDYKNKRDDYVRAWWSVVDWENAAKRYQNFIDK